MADYLIQIFNNDNIIHIFSNINNTSATISRDIIIDNYFFLYKNYSRELSNKIIKKYFNDIDIKENEYNNNNNNEIKIKNKIRNKNFYAIPFLFIKKLIESIDGKIFTFESIKIDINIW